MLALVLSLSAFGFDHDHAELGRVLDGAVIPDGVDYGVVASRQDALQHYLGTLADAPVATFSKEAQLAFWINAYNGLTLQLMVSSGPPASIMDLDEGKVWKTRRYPVGGEQLTLDQIEHQRIRPLGDGRIHAAINCASKGCPPLPAKPATAAHLEAHLDEAARTWARTNAYRLEGDTLQLSEIFHWFPEDFPEGPVPFLVRYLPEDRAAALRQASTTSWMPYDWSLNASSAATTPRR